MDISTSPQERKNKQKAVISSTIIHTVILVLLLLPLMKFPIPPPGQEGILVNLGLLDQGQGEENTKGPNVPEATAEEAAEPEEEPVPKKEEKPEEKEIPKKTEPVVKEKEVLKTEDPDAIALKKQKEEEARKKSEADAKKRAEEEAKRKAADEEARKKAEADKLKEQLSGGFGGGGKGSGKGNTGTPGNQGDPGGDPNSKNLEGISTGTGTIGGGLGDRGVSRAPKIEDNSQQQGTVVVKVCVDKNGDVISADFTQAGTTISDDSLRKKAVANAKQWKFSKGEVDKQCGTITYRFKVQ